MGNTMPKALEGMKVVDSATFIAGPLGAKILGDLGADVIHVENRFAGGDASRTAGSPFIDGVASFVQTLNAGKKCICINTKDPRGIQLYYDLLKETDVYIDNRPVGVSEKLGLGYDKLKEINPGLIVIRVTGFGMTDSKYRDWAAFDPIFEGLAGFMAVNGEPGTPPVKAGVAIADCSGGVWIASAALSAYIYKLKTGKGQLIDYSLTDGLLALMENNVATYSFSGVVPGKFGNRHPNVGPLNTFKCLDGYVFLAVGVPSQAMALADLIGHPELKEDERYSTNNLRAANADWIESFIHEWLKDRSAAETIEALTSAGIPAGPIYNMQDVFEDPYFWDRGMLVKVQHPTIGEITIPGTPLGHFSETPAVVDKACGLLGAENAEIFKDRLGLSDELFDQYMEEKVI
jgi:crotonobetainyl-CoA:carnitine CoA-transferase CaiB-like acyl-CoA transferase